MTQLFSNIFELNLEEQKGTYYTQKTYNRIFNLR